MAILEIIVCIVFWGGLFVFWQYSAYKGDEFLKEYFNWKIFN